MIQVSVLNTINNRTFSAVFPDTTTAQNWIAQQETINSWGLPQRTLTANEQGVVTDLDGSSPNLSLAISTSTSTDLNGISVTSYVMPAQYVVTSTDITAQYNAQQLLIKGQQAQAIGAQCMAQVYALNDAKFAAGTLTTADFQSILQDTTLQQIERLLWAGALATAQSMLSTYTSPYYTSADIATVTAIITNSGLVP